MYLEHLAQCLDMLALNKWSKSMAIAACNGNVTAARQNRAEGPYPIQAAWAPVT